MLVTDVSWMVGIGKGLTLGLALGGSAAFGLGDDFDSCSSSCRILFFKSSTFQVEVSFGRPIKSAGRPADKLDP